MASNTKYSLALKNAQQDRITAAAGANCLIDVMSGTQATNPDTALGSQVILATLTGNATFAPGAAAGVLTLNSITSNTGTAGAGAGTVATWFRMKTSGGVAQVDGTVGTVVTNALTASASGGLLTVSAAAAATIAVGQAITGSGVPANTTVIALGTGTGGTGTYYLNNAVNLSSQSMTASTVFDLNINNTNIATGQTVAVTSWTLTNNN